MSKYHYRVFFIALVIFMPTLSWATLYQTDPPPPNSEGCNVPYGYSWVCNRLCSPGFDGLQICGKQYTHAICMTSPSPGNACFSHTEDACCAASTGF